MARFHLFLLLYVSLMLTSCEAKLSEEELKVVNRDLSMALYKQSINEMASPLFNYLWEGVDDYAEYISNEISEKIAERNATSSFLGGSFFDFAELYGTSTNQILADQYNAYVNYVNRHQDDMISIINGLVEGVAENPSIINDYMQAQTLDLSLGALSGIGNLPASIPFSEFGKYEELQFDEENKIKWGASVMGTYKKPFLSAVAILDAVLTVASGLEEPKPVYAIYDSETDSWDIGYDTEQALTVKFTQKSDILHYKYAMTNYSDAYIASKMNVLNNK